MNKMRDRFRGCLLGLAIGDALGSEVEFIHTREDILAVTGGTGVIDLPESALFTDDTQMTLCVAEALIEGGQSIDTFMPILSKKFVEWYELQKTPEHRRAPGSTCLTACQRLAQGISWEESGIPSSMGCGSGMRSSPIGLYHSKSEKVVEFGISSSTITHPHELALCASVATALLTHYALNDDPVGLWGSQLVEVVSFNVEFCDLIKKATEMAATRQDPDYVLSKKCLGEGWTGHEAVASALYCAMMHPDSYEKAVLLAANAVGDSDSLACITGAWLGTRLGVSNIPQKWVEKIENRDKLIETADNLLKRSNITIDDGDPEHRLLPGSQMSAMM